MFPLLPSPPSIAGTCVPADGVRLGVLDQQCYGVVWRTVGRVQRKSQFCHVRMRSAMQ